MLLKIGGLALLVFVAAFYLVPLARERKERWRRLSATVLEQHLHERGGAAFPEYRVRYAWNGQQYERVVGLRGRGYPLHDPRGRHVRMREFLARRMRATRELVRIEVNPANPSDAHVVEYGTLPPDMIFWVIGAIFLLFFLVFAYVAFA